MKKKSLQFLLFLCFSATISFAQIQVEKTNDESTTQGVFVNNGQQKIDALECYDFRDLIVSFNLRQEFFAYERIAVLIEVGVFETNSFLTPSADPNQYVFYIDRAEFANLFRGKKYAYFKIFSSSDMSEKSVWKTASGKPFTRAKLQYAEKKLWIEKSEMKVSFACGTYKGMKTVYDNSSGQTVARNIPQWQWDYPITFKIGLKNRLVLPLLKDFPPAPVGNGNCYNTTNASESKSVNTTTIEPVVTQEVSTTASPKEEKVIQNNGAFANEGYYEDGKKKFEGDKINGSYKSWNQSGQLETEETYSNGKKNGIAKYYMSGVLRRQGNYINDKEDGVWVYYHSNNNKSEEGNFKNGNKDGLWQEWDRGGKITHETVYMDGKLNGVMKNYDIQGNVTSETPYENGVRNGRGFIIKGGVKTEQLWKDGSLQQ